MVEIERKFLVSDDSYKSQAISAFGIEQGYLSANPNAVMRVRIRTILDLVTGFEIGGEAFLTVKSKTRGISRGEWEYEIPLEDAREIMQLCVKKLEKTRYIVPYNGFKWEVDVFKGKNQGLTVAEIELPTENTHFDLPPFISKEVTGNPLYFNSNLATCNT